MSALQQFKEGLGQAWDAVVEGWRQLFQRAGRALTRFRPGGDEEEGREVAVRSSGWGLLAAEVSEGDKTVTVRLEIPGLEKEDLDVEVEDQTLVVRGEKRISREHRGDTYHLTECAYGRFQRVIPLPAPVDPARARARYRNGVLEVELPKTAAARRVSVKSA